jgi:hypothetical protein
LQAGGRRFDPGTLHSCGLAQTSSARLHDSLTVSRERTSVSPELALVDPGLGEWARERLPEPPDILEALEAARTKAPSAPATSEHPSRRWRSRVMTWTGIVVVLAGTAFLVGSRLDGESPTAAPLPSTSEPQPPTAGTVTSEAARPSARTPSPSTGPGTRRFAWPPVAGASGYHVELFKGSALVFRNESSRPQILIPRRWRFDGRLRRLDPGEYRWYVWPVVDGRRRASALVQARLVVPPA